MTTITPDPGTPDASVTAPRRPPAAPRWWRRPWVAPLFVVVAAFLAFSLPPYLSLDATRSRVPAPEWFPPHFVMLSLHVIFGSIAMVSCCLQIWPWFRNRHPAAHRRIGRVYVFAGVLPSGLMGLVIGIATPFGPVAMASDVLLALLWLGYTFVGFRLARHRRFAEHRRWMVRSFALCMSIITNRLWGVVTILSLSEVPRYAGNPAWLTEAAAGMNTWLGWVLPLLAAEWWLERDASRRRARRRAAI
ncbi:DUF2306 domain-containing protein [Nonomuraea soli]|uniref:DUF2306 domain-containing protein n=1 Tax=Nonomuraea soli TaxID=1032476 RepID=A0A7W0CRD6_9ACTN|nr:DUF2306 domain-containing protein [Nonomuraea soli]MBA2895939.1 hypothetical protein [Nonomuraea soli]